MGKKFFSKVRMMLESQPVKKDYMVFFLWQKQMILRHLHNLKYIDLFEGVAKVDTLKIVFEMV